MTRKGFLLGKFMPPHAGHLHLIDEAAKLCDELTILVCTVEREPIPGALRFAWMQELRGSRHTVVHVTDDVPSYPHEHPDFWPIWEALLRRVLPDNVDVVFSSEEYGEEVARRLGIAHVAIDPLRIAVPVSATMIRNDPLACWQYIPAPVRPWFAKRVAVVGAESCGKSTLAQRLAKHFATCHVEEYGREHTASMSSVSAEITPADFLAIADEHARRTEEAARSANRLLSLDTDALTTAVWNEWYLGECATELWRRVEQQRIDFFLLLAPDIPWKDDGTREFPHRRQQFFERVRAELDRRRCQYAVIECAGDERLRQAVAAVRARWPTLRA